MGFGLQTARTGLRYRNPVIERTAISRVSRSFRGDLQPGKVAMPRGPRSEKRPADLIGAGRYLPWASPKFKLSAKRGPAEAGLMHVSRFSSSTGTTQWSRQQGNELLWPLVFCMARVADIDSLDVRLFHQCRRIAFVAKQRLAAAGEQQPENVWLIGAVALSLFTHVLVIYVPADGVQYGGAVDVRLGDRDRRCGHAAHRDGGGQIRVANGTSSRSPAMLHRNRRARAMPLVQH
jgi:hypothetical protein